MTGVLSFAIRILLGGLFLISGVAKIIDPIRFLFTVRDFRFFPGTVEPFLALFLPWFEFVLGLFVLLGLFLRTSSLMLGGLNALFIVAILSVIMRGFEIDCGCFGLLADWIPLPDMADYRAVARNLAFIGMCAYLYRSKRVLFSIDGLLARSKDGSESA